MLTCGTIKALPATLPEPRFMNQSPNRLAEQIFLML